MNLFLIGYRCTGKTTVGQALGKRIGWSFKDTDRMIMDIAGASIAWIVDEKGWGYFREKERLALASVAAMDREVVATGGGIVLDNRNISAMKASGTVVWLTAGLKTIAARMLADDTTAANRPSLTGEGWVDEVETVMAQRSPLYEAAADFTIDTDEKNIEAICNRIVALLGV